MKSSMRPKIMMFLSGLAGKYDEGKDYFISVEATLRSGGKEYPASIVQTGDCLEYVFLSSSVYEGMDDAMEALADDIIKYESAVVSYCERGQTTDILIDDRNVKMVKRENESQSSDVSQLRRKDYIINPSKASALMKTLGYMTDDGKLRNDKIRKYNQTERFVELIDGMFGPEDNNLHVVDCACGKSYLSFVLNYYFWEKKRIKAEFTGIDIKEGVIEESRRMADELGYKNMNFICQDLRDYRSSFRPDVVISLHACDTATDMALGYAIRSGASKIICVPCCHRELLDKYKKDDLDPIIRHGVFRARMNDVLTDGLRVAKLESEGYEVSVVEYCSPLDTPKNLLIRAVKKGKGTDKARSDYYGLLRTLGVTPAIEYYSMIGGSEYDE